MRIATDVDDFFDFRFYRAVEHALVATFSRRVENERNGFSCRLFFAFAEIKRRRFYFVGQILVLRLRLLASILYRFDVFQNVAAHALHSLVKTERFHKRVCVVHRARLDFDGRYVRLFKPRCDLRSQKSHARIEFHNITVEICKFFAHFVVYRVAHVVVYLQKRHRRNYGVERAEILFFLFSVHEFDGFSENDVGVLSVFADINANARKFFFEILTKFGKFRHSVRIYDESHRQRIEISRNDVAQYALSARFVVNADMIEICPVCDDLNEFCRPFAVQSAPLHRHDRVRAFFVKAESHSARISLVAERKRDFVAIFPVVEAHHVRNFHVQTARLFERVFDVRFFNFELTLARDVLQIATAASAEISAFRFNAVGGRLFDFDEVGKSVVLFCIANSGANNLALYCKRHENGVRADFDDTLALACKVANFAFYYVPDSNRQHSISPFNAFLYCVINVSTLLYPLLISTPKSFSSLKYQL